MDTRPWGALFTPAYRDALRRGGTGPEGGYGGHPHPGARPIGRRGGTWMPVLSLRAQRRAVLRQGRGLDPRRLLRGAIPVERYERLLTAARDANMNMLRVWGGGIYETTSSTVSATAWGCSSGKTSCLPVRCTPSTTRRLRPKWWRRPPIRSAGSAAILVSLSGAVITRTSGSTSGTTGIDRTMPCRDPATTMRPFRPRWPSTMAIYRTGPAVRTAAATIAVPKTETPITGRYGMATAFRVVRRRARPTEYAGERILPPLRRGHGPIHLRVRPARLTGDGHAAAGHPGRPAVPPQSVDGPSQQGQSEEQGR